MHRTLSVTVIGTLLTLIAFTAPLATINSTALTLGADTAGRTWIMSSMSIGLGAVLLSAGTIADDFGRRRTFVVGAAVLAVGATVCALATTPLVFVLARIVSGVGGAAIVASTLGLIAHAFPVGPARAAASGVWGAGVGGGIAIGPLLASLLDRYADWRDIYWLIGIGAVVIGTVAQFALGESRAEHSRGLDLAGTVLLGAGISALLAALVEGRQGWTQPVVLALAVAALVLLAAFVVTQYRGTSPMLDRTLFRQPAFVVATGSAFTTGAGIIALMSYLSGFVGVALGISAVGAATLLLCWSGISVVTALLARRIPSRISGRVQLAFGLVGVGVGMLTMTGLQVGSGWDRFLPGMIIAGVASGVLNAALGREAVASVPAGRASMGSGANNTARYVGSAIGVTVVAVIAARPAGDAAALVSGWNHAAIVTAAISVVGGLVVLGVRARRVAVERELVTAATN